MKKLFAILCAAGMLTPSQSPAAIDYFRPLLDTTPYLPGDCINNEAALYNKSNPNSQEPIDKAAVLIGYWGDPGTPEAVNAATNPITWPLEQLLHTPTATYKRGFWNLNMEDRDSSIALSCSEMGALINTYQFNHNIPVSGGGPQAQLFRKASQPIPLFTHATKSKVYIQAAIKHPHHRWDVNDPGDGQIVLAYYVQPLKCPTKANPNNPCPLTNGQNVPFFAHVIALYHNLNGVGTYNEVLSNDGFNAYFSSPLADMQPNGTPPNFLKRSPYSYPMATTTELWNDYRFFRAEISQQNMANMINILRSTFPNSFGQYSADPMDWGIILVTSLLEVVPHYPGANSSTPCNRPMQGESGCNNVEMGAVFTEVSALEHVSTYETTQPSYIPANATLPPPDYEATRPFTPSTGMAAPVISMERIRERVQ